MTIDHSAGRVLDILAGDPLLRTTSTQVGEPDETIRTLAIDMLATMYAAPGVGLAAVQVGRPVRMIVFDASPDGNRPEIMIDPVVTWARKRTVPFPEGCLSVPGRTIEIERPTDVDVAYTDLAGARLKRSLGGLPARIVQHEIDHLDGITIEHRP